MRFRIKHEIRGRIRIHLHQNRMTCREADILHYYLSTQKFVTSVKVYERTGDAAICYVGERDAILQVLREFQYEEARCRRSFCRIPAGN